MSKKTDPAKAALLKAAEAARKVMRRHGYDLPEEAIMQSYMSETGTDEANTKVSSAQQLGGQARAKSLSSKRRSDIAKAAAKARWQAKKGRRK